MVAIEQQAPGRATVAQRWLARPGAGGRGGGGAGAAGGDRVSGQPGGDLAGVAGLALAAAGVWWALTHKGLVRWLAVAVAVLAPLVVLVLYTSRGLLWVVLVAVGLLVVAVAAGRAALGREAAPERMREHDAAPPKRPFLIMNPRSGGGKVTRFGLKDKAEALGATVALLEGPGTGGRGRPGPPGGGRGGRPVGGGRGRWHPGAGGRRWRPSMMCRCWSSRPGPATTSPWTWGWTAKTRRGAWTRSADGVELRVDLGFIAGRPFVNNASFGAYAAIVQSPAYRDDKARTTLDQLPGLLAGQQGPRLVARAENVTVQGPQAVLVSNNQYGMGDIAGLGRRARLDRGTLGMFAVTVTQRRPGRRAVARAAAPGA